MTKKPLYRKREYFYKMAKKEKYRSRASYKLLELNKKFKIIKKHDYVLDLGAAPGGWSQVALDIVGDKGMVIGVDLQSIKPFDSGNFIQIKGDFRDTETREQIKEITGGKVDVILSDASPKLTGIKNIDHMRSVELVKTVLEIVYHTLKNDGKIVIKVFLGEEFENILKEIKNKFKMVKTTKPTSSRKKSAEMYVIAQKKVLLLIKNKF
jgi:23S rRNA (uridine2552-2'-O)-methyltransferase